MTINQLFTFAIINIITSKFYQYSTLFMSHCAFASDVSKTVLTYLPLVFPQRMLFQKLKWH